MQKTALKTKLIEVINTSDDNFLQLVNELYVNYSKKNNLNAFDELPTEVKELLSKSRKEAREGKLKSHNEVMNHFREKYKLSN